MVKKICYVLDKRQKRNFLILSAIIIIGSLVELLGVAVIAPLVAIVSDETIIHTDEIYVLIGKVLHISTVYQYVLVFIFSIIVIYIIKNMYIIMQNYFQYKYIFNNQRRISTKLMTFYLQKPYLYHVNTNVADIQRNITTDVNAMFDAMLNIFYIFNETLVCALLVIFLAYEDLVSTILMGSILLLFVIIFLFIYRKYSVSLGDRARKALARQNKWILQGFAGVKEVMVSGRESFFSNNFDKATYDYADLIRKKTFINMAPKPVMEVVCIDGLLLIVGIRIMMGADIKSFLPILSVFAVAAFRMLPSFNRISQYTGTVMFGKPSVENVYKDMYDLRNSKEQKEDIKSDIVFDMESDVEISNITFKYPAGEDNVLENVTFTIPHKKSVALIGASGSGKSTLADIILGILSPSAGNIAVDGESIFNHIESWHEKIGYIPQVIYLMDDTIRNNIAFGIERNEIDDEKIWDAIRSAQLEEFIKDLPDGIDTMVGDRGVRLSGGQRQRIGIARALYKNPEFLVLDEATSALDNDTEKAVMEAIDGLHGSRTMLIIAHRLSTIANCDYIYEVADKGIKLRDKESVI